MGLRAQGNILTFPFGRDDITQLRRARPGLAWHGRAAGEHRAGARRRHQRRGRYRPHILGEEALALNSSYRQPFQVALSDWAGRRCVGGLSAEAVSAEPLLVAKRDIRAKTALMPYQVQTTTVSLKSRRRPRPCFPQKSCLRCRTRTGRAGLFDDMKVAVTKPGSIGSTLVPACGAGGWLGAS